MRHHNQAEPRRVRVERAEHPIPPRKPEKSEKKENNPPERKREEKRGSKRKYVDQRSVEAKKILPFVTTYHPSVRDL